MTRRETPTAAAEALDVMNLPVGTWVRWYTDQGYSGGRPDRGEISKVTERSYILTSWLGDTARIERTMDGVRRRHLTAVRTPEEQQAYEEQNRIEQAQRQEQFQADQRQIAERDRQRRAEDYALRALRESHLQEFDDEVARYLAKHPMEEEQG